MPFHTYRFYLYGAHVTFCIVTRHYISMQVPPQGKGSLYIRPLLMGSGAVLGLAPAPEYTFLIYVSPVGNYFKVG